MHYLKSPHGRGRAVTTAFLLTTLTCTALTTACGSQNEAASISKAAQSFPHDEIARLTNEVLTTADQYNNAGLSEQAALSEKLSSLTKQRAAILSDEAKIHPKEVIQTALPAQAVAKIPDFARKCIEKRIDQVGSAEVVATYHDDRDPDLFYSLNDDQGHRYTLHFSGEAPAIQSGETVRITGVHVPCGRGTPENHHNIEENASHVFEDGIAQGCLQNADGACTTDPVAMEGGTAGITAVAAAALPGTLGEQTTAAILVSFQDKANTYTTTQLSSVLKQTSDYWYEASFKQTWITGSVFGPYTLTLSSTTCSYDAMATQARAAASAAGVDLSRFKRFLFIFPYTSACSWAGLGTVGGSPSKSWINGSIRMGLYAHEMGHNLGLYHAKALNCGTSAITGAVGSACSTIEYGDTTDVMGQITAHYTAFHKERLGWLGTSLSPSIQTVQMSGTYVIDPYESYAMTPKALKILKSTDPTTGAKTYYYIEFRQPLGFDSVFSTLGTNNLAKGVVVHTGVDTNVNSSLLLNINPSYTSRYQAALNPGQTYEDVAAGVRVQLVSYDTTKAVVNVTMGGTAPVCTRANPTINLSPAQSAAVQSGTAVDYTVTVKNNDSSDCAASDFAVAGSVPSTSWSSSVAAPMLTAIAPGGIKSTVLRVSSPVGLAAGSYVIGARATNNTVPSFTASTSASYVVAQTGLTVSVTTDRTTYYVGNYIYLRVYGPAGAAYSLRIIRPDGTYTPRTGTVGTSGYVAYSFSTSYSQKGRYDAVATATKDGLSGTATKTFYIQ